MARAIWNLRVAFGFWRLGVMWSNAWAWAKAANESWFEHASPREAVQIELEYWEA